MRESFARDYREARTELGIEIVVSGLARLVTFGLLNRSWRVRECRERYDRAKRDLERYEQLHQAHAYLDANAKRIAIEGVREGQRVEGAGSVLLPTTYGPNWDSIRDMALTRDGYACQESDGRCSGPLHIHHRIPLSKGGSNGLGNLITLCEFHHTRKHPHMEGKSRGNLRRRP